jgi:hypothetical protein
MNLFCVARRIASANGRVSWYFSNGIAAIPPAGVATLAVLLQDGQHVAIKGRRIRYRSVLPKRSAQPQK